MSEMVANKGIIKELYPEIKNRIDKIKQLCVDTGLDFDTVCPFIEDEYIDHSDYDFIDGRLFDISGAPTQYDCDQEKDYVKKISDTEYEVDLYFYNGGVSMGEMVEQNIDEADKEYNNLKFVKFTEYNDNEGEEWNFWLQYNGNEEQINKLFSILSDESLYDYDDYSYTLSLVTYPEDEVDILVKHSRSGYMDYENKVTGKFTCPNMDGFKEVNDTLYKGHIKKLWENK